MASNTLHYWRILTHFDVYFGSGRCGVIGYCVTVRSGIHRLHRMTSTSGEYPSRADCGFVHFWGGSTLNPSTGRCCLNWSITCLHVCLQATWNAVGQTGHFDQPVDTIEYA